MVDACHHVWLALWRDGLREKIRTRPQCLGRVASAQVGQDGQDELLAFCSPWHLTTLQHASGSLILMRDILAKSARPT